MCGPSLGKSTKSPGARTEGKIRRPNDCLALDQFKNLILPVIKMSRRPEAGRSAIVKNGELPPAVSGANPDARLLAPRCPRYNARRCCSINRDRTRSNSLGRHACSFLLLMRDTLRPVRDLQPLAGLTRRTFDPDVWSGRALQEFRDLVDAVLHQCIRPLLGARCAPGHHGYQRACDLISGQASTGPNGSIVLHAPGRPVLHCRLILSQTSAASRD